MNEATMSAGGLDFTMELRDEGKDGGPSLRVYAPVDGQRVQVLRFDMFRVQPHYHYDPTAKNLRYDLDPLTIDDGIGWAIGFLGRKLPEILDKTGYAGLSNPAAVAAVTAALPEIETRWRGVSAQERKP